jgi:anti-anti-sigma factor
MQNEFRVEVKDEAHATVLAVQGELDLASSSTLEEELARVPEDRSLIILDLRELEFMDSTGLSVVVKAHQRAEERGHRFGLVRGRPQVQRLLTLTGVAGRIEIGDSPEDLIAGAPSPPAA